MKRRSNRTWRIIVDTYLCSAIAWRDANELGGISDESKEICVPLMRAIHRIQDLRILIKTNKETIGIS